MAIERQGVDDTAVIPLGRAMEVTPEPSRDDLVRQAVEVLVTEDGVLVDDEIDAAPAPLPAEAFDANLADSIPQIELMGIAKELLTSIEADKESRAEWEKTYVDGLKYLGMKFDEMRSTPFQGSSGVIHPILAEAVTQFQAQAYKEMLPARGPVKTEIVGARTPEVEAQADRIAEFMNFYLLNVCEEYDPELDQMLFFLPLAGSAFKKVYYDTAKNKAASKFIQPQDLIVPYEATDIFTAERVTHVVEMSSNEIRKLQLSGFYSDVSIKDGPYGQDRDEIEEQIDAIEGIEPSYQNSRDHLIYEVHTVLDLPGYEDLGADGQPTGLKLPYILTIDENSQKVLSIRRNYREDDPFKAKINYFVQFKFLPGLGFYGLGLSHMIGGIAKASTSILRQLIDAGTLANLPAGFKARGMRIRDEDEPLQPGEFRDIDTTGGNLRENLIPLPIKEPSNVLMSLLGLLVDSGKRFASIADMNVGDMNQAMPVGTTVALLERGTKVMSAIHKRLHYSQRVEFQLLARVFGEFLPPSYPYATGSGPQEIKAADFDGRVDVFPVSDPNIFSQSQRITMAQELLQLVQSNPQVHGPQGIYEAYRRMYNALGVDNVESLLQPPAPPPQPMPMDAGIENAGLLAGQPQQAFPGQNHRAHIDVHRSLFLTEIVKQTPAIQALIISHCMQHLQFMATEMAAEQLPPELQQQMAQLEQAVMSGQLPMEAAQPLQQQVMQVQEQISSPILAELTQDFLLSIGQASEQDPLVAIRQRELDIREAEMQQDAKEFDAKEDARAQEKLLERELARERLSVQKDINDEKMDLAIQRLAQQADLKMLELQAKFGFRV